MEERCKDCFTRRGGPYPIYLTRRRSRRFKSPEKRRVRRFLQRVVTKSGRAVVHRKTIPQRSYRYLIDLANTFISSRWEWALLAVSLVFLATWLLFACLWLLIARLNGDLNTENKTIKPCLTGIHGFAGYLLFSVETQTTIGYGNRSISHHCPEAIFLMCVQTVMGICICGGLVSIVYTKMSSPQKLSSMNSFSKHAVICQRDGQLCLMFRVRDCVGRYQCHNSIRAYLVENRGGDLLLKSIHLESMGALIWPIEIVHVITETSPFWDLSAKDLIMKRFEIILTMEGESLPTACMSLTTASYLSKEIFWGHRFTNCIDFDEEEQRYIVDHRLFNATVETDTPLCSAKRLDEIMQEISEDVDIDLDSLQPRIEVSRDEMGDEDSGRYTLSPVTVHRDNVQEADQSQRDVKGDSSRSMVSPVIMERLPISEYNHLNNGDSGKGNASPTSTHKDLGERYHTTSLHHTAPLATEYTKPQKNNSSGMKDAIRSDSQTSNEVQNIVGQLKTAAMLTRVSKSASRLSESDLECFGNTSKAEKVNFMRNANSALSDNSFCSNIVKEETQNLDPLFESLNQFFGKTNRVIDTSSKNQATSDLLETPL